MMSRYEAILNGVALSSFSDVVITDIQYQTPNLRNEVYAVAKRQGSRIRRRYIEKATVVISFMIRAYNIDHRKQICGEISKWAKNGGILETNDMMGKRLRCVCDQFPSITSALRWTDTLKIAFSAYSFPFWEEKYPVSLTLANGASGSLFVPGNVDEALIEATVTANASISSFALTANGKTLTLSGLSMTSGQTAVISYDDDMIQSIKIGTTSILNKRTGADDLIAKCGESNALSVTASGSVSAVFSVRGVWL